MSVRESDAQFLEIGASPHPSSGTAKGLAVLKTIRRLSSGRLPIQIIVVATVFAAWYLATTATNLVGPGRFPSPADVRAAWDQIISADGYAGGALLDHVIQSCWIIAGGFAAAVATGVPLGLLMGASRDVEAFVGPVFSL